MTEIPDAETALSKAVEYLDLAHGDGNDEVNAVIERLNAILAQKGCEHFDPACRDGKLTRLIDIVIDG